MTVIKAAANERLWDASVGMFRDNDTSTLLPQDGNVWSILSQIVQNTSQALSIASYLESRWTPYGAVAVEVCLVYFTNVTNNPIVQLQGG